MTTYAAAIAARLQRGREDEDMARKKTEDEAAVVLRNEVKQTRATIEDALAYLVELAERTDPTADARVAELERELAEAKVRVNVLEVNWQGEQATRAELERELDTVTEQLTDTLVRAEKAESAILVDAFRPVPLRWRYVRPGDVLAVKRGDEVEPWLVRRSQAGDPTGWSVEVARTGKDVPRNVDPDDEVPVLVAAAVADAFVVLREQGAEMVGRS